MNGNGACTPSSPYEIPIDPNLQEENRQRATFYTGRDKDLNGNFAGKHFLKFSKQGLEIPIYFKRSYFMSRTSC